MSALLAGLPVPADIRANVLSYAVVVSIDDPRDDPMFDPDETDSDAIVEGLGWKSEYDNTLKVTARILLGDAEIGTARLTVVDREAAGPSFYQTCDAESAALEMVSKAFFAPDGRTPRSAPVKALGDEVRRGGFCYLDEFLVDGGATDPTSDIAAEETEKALEELKQNFETTKEQMDGKTRLLKQNIDELEQQIAAEESKAAQLRGRLQARAGETQGRQEKLLAQLHEKVRDVYQKCGFDVGSKPSTLFMLSELEARLEQLLDHIETMSEEYIMKEEKDKEKKRRERKRQEQQALQDAQQEERNRKSIARSMQAPKKRTGRQVMFRSAPMRQAVREEKEEEEDDLDELKYMT